MSEANNAFEILKQALAEITNGKNLEKWDCELTEAIDEVNKAISEAMLTGIKTEGYDKLKNELYALKYLISEQT